MRWTSLALLSLVLVGTSGAVCIGTPGSPEDDGVSRGQDADNGGTLPDAGPDAGEPAVIVATCSVPAEDATCTSPHCTALRTEIRRSHDDIVADHGACSVDEDCIVFDRSLSCEDGRNDLACGVAIARARQGDYETALSGLCQEYCKSCYGDCDGFSERCPEAFAYCSAGRCASWATEVDGLCPDDPDVCGTVRNPLCPEWNPAAGTACSLDEQERCSYCQGSAGSGLSVYEMRCVDGRWRMAGEWVCDVFTE